MAATMRARLLPPRSPFAIVTTATKARITDSAAISRRIRIPLPADGSRSRAGIPFPLAVESETFNAHIRYISQQGGGAMTIAAILSTKGNEVATVPAGAQV